MGGRGKSSLEECPVQVGAGGVTLEGDLCVPEEASGVVLFAHGSGSSRRSLRNRYVARVLREAGLATLLFDLLTAEEEAQDIQNWQFRFDIALMADRLVDATDWVRWNPETRDLKVSYFGASTGAAAALVAATRRADVVSAIVSRGGRPDLARTVLPQVKAPTLLIVGGRDYQVIKLNQTALEKLDGEKELVIVPGATHLFEEPGALDEVARLATDWFVRHFKAG